ncbi:uncharacterized protein [Saccopteryx leptura]|uniref:uncharacterized protein isoform X1 n=1 Tax=Saccopteryx leptura TaxID=249018 RepID=UPI00339D222C
MPGAGDYPPQALGQQEKVGRCSKPLLPLLCVYVCTLTYPWRRGWGQELLRAPSVRQSDGAALGARRTGGGRCLHPPAGEQMKRRRGGRGLTCPRSDTCERQRQGWNQAVCFWRLDLHIPVRSSIHCATAWAQIPDAPQGPAETSARRTEMEAPVASPSPENPRALPPLTAPASPSQPATPRGQTWPAQGGDPGVTISSSSASPN